MDEQDQSQSQVTSPGQIQTGGGTSLLGEQQGAQVQQQQQQAPDSYEKFNVPDGFDPIDETTHNDVSTLGKEFNLNQQQLQKFIDLGSKKIGDGMEAMRLKALAMHEEWRKVSESDPEIKEGLPHAIRLIDRFGNQELRNMLTDTGVGNHREFILFCIRMGKLHGEAPFIQSGQPAVMPQTSVLSSLAEKYRDKM
jgi:hypothetical protein